MNEGRLNEGRSKEGGKEGPGDAYSVSALAPSPFMATTFNKRVSQEGHFSTKQSVRRDISVQNSQSGGIFQYKTVSQEGYFGIKYSAGRDIQYKRIRQ